VADAVVRQEGAVPTLFAFLRAINVGGRTVKMEQLRREFESLGFSGVETFIASGNIIFEARARNEERLREKIEAHLQKAFGYEVASFIRSRSELRQIAHHRPFSVPETDRAHSVLVAFLSSPPDPVAAKNLIACRSETDDFHIQDREVYWLCRTRLSDSKFSGGRLEKIVGRPATTRNMTTIKRLAARYP
jgi:uncharacterized protein (DUF1697 family)